MIKYISSCEGDNAWLVLIRAHDHVWRDWQAAQLLHELSIVVATGKTAEERESVLPGEY